MLWRQLLFRAMLRVETGPRTHFIAKLPQDIGHVSSIYLKHRTSMCGGGALCWAQTEDAEQLNDQC